MIDTNLLSNAGFFVHNTGNGVLTTQINFVIDEDNQVATKLREIDFSLSNYELVMEDAYRCPLDVTPSFDGNGWLYHVFFGSDTESCRKFLRVKNFIDFVRDNPVHITKINIRATNAATIPAQIVVETPNIFEGYATRQIIDVTSRKDAYQYQNNIVTIENLDLTISRNSLIKFDGGFSLAVQDLNDNPVFIDWTIDYYISLEKAIIENIKLLKSNK